LEAGKQNSWEAGKRGSREAMRLITKKLGYKKGKRPEVLENSIILLVSKFSSYQAFQPPSFKAFQHIGFPASWPPSFLAYQHPERNNPCTPFSS
jgi:hypothetical protein